MPRLRDWAVHHPRVVDGCVAVLIAALVLPVTLGGATAPGALEPGTGVTGFGWLGFVTVHVPLVWRRRNPVLVFWVVIGLAVLCVLSGFTGVFLIIAPLFALYAVARYGTQRQLWPAVGACAVALVIGLIWLQGTPAWPSVIGIFSMLLATVLFGVIIQLRRAYLAERAQYLKQELDHQAQMTVAAERTRIAREVHDIVAHNLAVMVALADGASATALTSPQRAADLIEKASMTGREALSEMRRLVAVLRDGDQQPGDEKDTERSPQPGLDDLDQLVEQVSVAGLRVEMTYEGQRRECAPDAGLAIYRIVQEALTNTLKHAGPDASARVRLRYADNGVELEIVDDGVGRSSRPLKPGGNGVAGIIERAAAYGGEAHVGPAPGAGWRVHATLPFTQTVT